MALVKWFSQLEGLKQTFVGVNVISLDEIHVETTR